jgi:hypothetical protein
MYTSELLDLVYESRKDCMTSNFKLSDHKWGNIREELRQIDWNYEEGSIGWEIEAEQTSVFDVGYSARFEDYLIEGVIEGRIENMDYF